MPAPPSTANLNIGGIGKLIVGGLDLGNIVSLEIDASDQEIQDHFTSRSGARKVDKRIVTQKNLTFTAELDEHQVDLYKKYFMGGGGANTVFPLTALLAETNCYIEWRNEAQVLWSYSHTKVNVEPDGAMDFGEFDDWPTYGLKITVLEDSVGLPSSPHGIFTFT